MRDEDATINLLKIPNMESNIDKKINITEVYQLVSADVKSILDLLTYEENDNIIIINKPINIDGSLYKNKDGVFNFEGNYKFKVSDDFPRGQKVLNFYNFNNLTIKNLKIEGNLTQDGSIFKSGDYVLTTCADWNNTIHPLWVSDCNNVYLNNIVLENHSGCGISTKRVKNVIIRDCMIDYCYQHNITVSVSDTKVLIDNCKCVNFGDLGHDTNLLIGGIGILVGESNNVTISNNKIIGTSDTGTKTEGCNHVEYYNNYVENFGKDGIKVQGYGTDVINIEDVTISHNFVKNRFWGRNDGSSYILMHDTTNGVIDGNTIIRDIINDAPVNDGIRVNLLNGTVSSNIKIINNTVNMTNGNNSINVYSADSNTLKEIILENNTINKMIQFNNVSDIIIKNNVVKKFVAIENKIMALNISNIIIESNLFYPSGLTNDNADAIYIQPKACNYVKIINNDVRGCGGRFIKITSTDTTNKIIDTLEIRNNRASISLGTISYPIAGIYLGLSYTNIIENIILNNSFTAPLGVTFTGIYWVHPSTNFVIGFTNLRDLTLNQDNVTIPLASQYGRVIGEIYSNTIPSYTTSFKAYDEIKNINPTSGTVKWVYNGTTWVAN